MDDKLRQQVKNFLSYIEEESEEDEEESDEEEN
jgi:hypothetical protein